MATLTLTTFIQRVAARKPTTLTGVATVTQISTPLHPGNYLSAGDTVDLGDNYLVEDILTSDAILNAISAATIIATDTGTLDIQSASRNTVTSAANIKSAIVTGATAVTGFSGTARSLLFHCTSACYVLFAATGDVADTDFLLPANQVIEIPVSGVDRISQKRESADGQMYIMELE